MYVLFDSGGTRTRVATSTDGHTLGEHVEVFESNGLFDVDMCSIASAARKLAGNHRIEGIIGGVAGVLDSSKSSLTHAPHKRHWEGKSIAKALSSEFGAPVRLENDTALVALGEAHFGAGQGHSIVAYLTFSTGVGGARVEGGNLTSHTSSFEPGHQLFLHSDLTYSTLEDVASGAQLARRYGSTRAAFANPGVRDSIERAVAIGVHNTLAYWSPDVVVLGGGLVTGTEGHVVNLDAVVAHVQRYSSVVSIPPIVKASCGQNGGLLGALTQVRYL